MSKPCGDPLCTKRKMCSGCFRMWWKREVCLRAVPVRGTLKRPLLKRIFEAVWP